MKTADIPEEFIFIDPKSTKRAIESLAIKHDLSSAHPFVEELKSIVDFDINDLPMGLIDRARFEV